MIHISLSFIALALTQVESTLVRPVTVLLVLAVPIFDTLTVMIRRVCNDKSVFKQDNTHLHHILLQHGFDGKKMVKIMLFLSVIFCGLSVLGVIFHIPDPFLFTIFAVYFVLNWFARDSLAGRLGQVMKGTQPKETLPEFSIDINSPFHGEKRYNVELQIFYSNYLSNLALPGKIVNILKAGFWAHIDEIGVICRECVVTISFPGVNELEPVEMPVKHLWISSQRKDQYHGFKFFDLKED